MVFFEACLDENPELKPAAGEMIRKIFGEKSCRRKIHTSGRGYEKN